ncbi:MAG: PepSY-like domain-containing protein [Phycisphaerales bacterium]
MKRPNPAVGVLAFLFCGTTAMLWAGGPAQATRQPEPPPAKNDLDDEERIIKFADAPEAVRSAALKVTDEKNIRRTIREADEGVLAFEIEYKDAKGEHSVKFSEAGLLMETERVIGEDALPAAVREQIAQHHKDAKITGAVEATETYYEVQLTSDGETEEAKFDANGLQILDR